MARNALSAQPRPPGMPIYWRLGDDPEMYRRAERIAIRWARDGVTEDELDEARRQHFESGAAELSGRAAGRGPIDPSFARAFWWLRECYQNERRRMAQADANDARETLAILAHHLADTDTPEHAVVVTVQTVALHMGLTRADAISAASDALYPEEGRAAA